MNLSFTQPDKLGERARLASKLLDALEKGNMDDAKKHEKVLLEQLRLTGHLSNDPSWGAHVEWGCVEFGIVHVCESEMPPDGALTDEWLDAHPVSSDRWLSIDPTTGEVKQA